MAAVAPAAVQADRVPVGNAPVDRARVARAADPAVVPVAVPRRKPWMPVAVPVTAMPVRLKGAGALSKVSACRYQPVIWPVRRRICWVVVVRVVVRAAPVAGVRQNGNNTTHQKGIQCQTKTKP